MLAAVDRAYIDDARHVSEEWHYRGGARFHMLLADSTSGAGAPHRVRARSTAPTPDPTARRPDHVRVHQPGAFAVQGDVYQRATPYVVGEEFHWYTGDGREGTFRVMALYPPNVVLAVFKDDLSSLWTDARALAMDSLFMSLGSPEVQAIYEASFGEGPAETSAETGQMLVMFHDGDPSDATGLTYSASNYRQSTVHFRRNPYWDDNSWYYSLVAHELGHAWQFKAVGRVSAVWSGEGIANWIAQERLRHAVGLELDANHSAHVELQGWPLRLPETGDFVAGYRESHPFLAFLVTRLVLDHGQSYADAARRVVVGASEGWHGRYFTAYDAIEYDPAGGLTNRMRQVVDEWDAVEARLDWMVSFALDDRSSLGRYRIPFVRGASQHYRPYHSFRMGGGASVSENFAGGGNYYFELVGDGALHVVANDGATLAGRAPDGLEAGSVAVSRPSATLRRRSGASRSDRDALVAEIESRQREVERLQAELAAWEATCGGAAKRLPAFTSVSGSEVDALYTPVPSGRRRALGPRARRLPGPPGLPRRLPLHPGAVRHHVPDPALDDAPVRRLRHRRRDPTSATATCWPRARPAFRSPSTSPPSWATTATIPDPWARSACAAWPSRRWPTWRPSSGTSPWTGCPSP